MTAFTSALMMTLLIPLSVPQATPVRSPGRVEVLNAARQMMIDARYCALVTIGSDGHPQAREVDAFAPDADMSVWVATNPVTRKVNEIKHNPRVTLYYAAHDGTGYVTLLGRAEVVSDPAEKAKRWKEDWTPFYTDKNRGRDYVLIRVRPSRLEIVSYPHKILNDPKTWQPVTIEFPEVPEKK